MTQNLTYDENFHKELIKLEDNNFWFISRNKRIEYILDKYVKDYFDNFLEIGCGTGYVTKMIAKKYPDKKIYASEYLFPDCIPLNFARVFIPSEDLGKGNVLISES